MRPSSHADLFFKVAPLLTGGICLGNITKYLETDAGREYFEAHSATIYLVACAVVYCPAGWWPSPLFVDDGGSATFREVVVCFNKTVLRGNRVTRHDVNSQNGFLSLS